MTKKNVWVQQRQDGQWEVKKDGAQRASSLHRTQREAAEAGRRAAKDERSELLIKGRDNKIRSKDSYGPDPLPPKDREH
jgi:hypothetical protein